MQDSAYFRIKLVDEWIDAEQVGLSISMPFFHLGSHYFFWRCKTSFRVLIYLLFSFLTEHISYLHSLFWACFCWLWEFHIWDKFCHIKGHKEIVIKGQMCLIHIYIYTYISHNYIHIYRLIFYISLDWEAYSFMIFSVTNRTKEIFSETAFSRKSVYWAQNILLLFLYFIAILIFYCHVYFYRFYNNSLKSFLVTFLCTLKPASHHLFQFDWFLVTTSFWLVQLKKFGPVLLEQST